jgi:hypothetical protein
MRKEYDSYPTNIWNSPCADSCEFKILRKPVEGEE